MKRTLLTLLTSFVFIWGYSQTFVASNGVHYEVIAGTSNEVSAVDYNTSSGSNVVIPQTVVHPLTGAKYSVTEVGADAFKSKGLTSVDLANTIKKINLWAFSNNNLTMITLPDNLERLVGSCFRNNSITSIDFGSSPDINLGNSSFGGNQLTSITIPGSISAIGNNVFMDNNITTITFEHGVGTVAVGAFWGNPLTAVICNSTVPATIFASASSDTYRLNTTEVSSRSSIDLIIPVGTMGIYVTDPGALWTGFKSVTEDPLVTSLNGEVRDVKLDFFPNPAQDIIFLDTELLIEKVELFKLDGAKVADKTLNNNQVDVSDLASGVYLLTTKTDQGVFTARITKR